MDTKKLGLVVATALSAVGGTTYFATRPTVELAASQWESPIFADGFDSACWMAGKEVLTKSSVSYGVYPTSRPNLMVTEWDNVWGYNNTTSPQVPWPGVGGSGPVFKGVKPNVLLCVHFHTPPNIATMNGSFKNPSYIAGPNTSMKMVARNGLMPTPGCFADNVATSDANFIGWKGSKNNPTGSCNIEPDADYYVLQWITDGVCSGQNCIIGSVSYHN